MNNNFVTALGVAVNIMQWADNSSRTREFACTFAADKYACNIEVLLAAIPPGEEQMLRNIRTDFS